MPVDFCPLPRRRRFCLREEGLTIGDVVAAMEQRGMCAVQPIRAALLITALF